MILSLFSCDIVQNVVAHFLALKDISALDRAVTNRHEREFLLNVFRNTIYSTEVSVTDTLCNWLATRNLMVRKATFPDVDERYSVVIPKAKKLTFSCRSEVDPAALLRTLSNSKHLETLVLRITCSLTDDHVAELTGKFRFLVELSLANLPTLTDAGIQKVVVNCRLLRSVEVAGCVNLTDKSFVLIAESYPKLSCLKMGFCREITDTSVQALARHSRQLKTLHMGYVDKISHDAVTALWDAVPGLTSVDLSFCTRLEEDTLVQLACKCRGLELLFLDMYPALTENTVSIFAEHCANLKLAYFGKARITDSAVETLTSRCRQLTHVDLNCCSLLTDASLHSIACHCPGLVRLNVAGCTRIHRAGSIVEVAQRCPQLEFIVLDILQQAVVDDVLVALTEHCPRLRYLSLVWCLQVSPGAMDTMRTRYGKQLSIRAPGEVDFILYIS